MTNRKSRRRPTQLPRIERRIACLPSKPAVARTAVVAILGALAGPATALAAFTLTAPATASFAVTLNGSDQTRTYAPGLTVTDTTPQSAGWNLTITSTQYTATGGKTLATTASTITATTFSCVSGCTANPTSSVAYPVAVPAGAGPPAAVKFYNAAANTGRGTFTITPTVTVAVPANTLTGSYTSTVTTALISGP